MQIKRVVFFFDYLIKGIVFFIMVDLSTNKYIFNIIMEPTLTSKDLSLFVFKTGPFYFKMWFVDSEKSFQRFLGYLVSLKKHLQKKSKRYEQCPFELGPPPVTDWSEDAIKSVLQSDRIGLLKINVSQPVSLLHPPRRDGKPCLN